MTSVNFSVRKNTQNIYRKCAGWMVLSLSFLLKMCIMDTEERMNTMIEQIELCPGVTLRALQTDQFKTACFSVNLLRPHTRQDAALDALLPSVLLRATAHYPDLRSISGHLDELYGASFGTLVRLRGEVKLVGFYADFIEDAYAAPGDSVFAPMVDFLEEVLYHPYTENGGFVPRFVEGEKQNLIHAIESALNDKRAYAVNRLKSIMCAEEAYGVPRLGYAEDVAAITPEALWAHYRRILSTSRIELFYAGHLPAEAAAAAFRRLFAGRAYTPSPAAIQTRHIPRAAEVREVAEEMEVTQGNLVMGLCSSITCRDSDYPALLLLNAVYGAGVTSKLFVNVREKRSLCYSVSSGLDKFKGLMLISSGIACEHYEIARDAILEELAACQRGEISSEELESARRYVLSSLQTSLEAPVRLDDYYIGRAVEPSVPELETLMEQIRALQPEALVRAAQSLTLDTIYFLKGVPA